LALAGVAGLAAARASRAVEQRVAREVLRAASAAGASVGPVRFSWLGPLRIEGVTLASRRGVRVTVDAVAVSWRLRGGSDPRSHVAAVALEGVRVRRGAFEAVLAAADLEVTGWERREGSERLRLRQRPTGGTVEARWTRSPGGRIDVALDRLDLAAARVDWREHRVLSPGRWSGTVAVEPAPSGALATGRLAVEAARLALGGPLGTDDRDLGPPTDVKLAWRARASQGTLEIEMAAARTAFFAMTGRGRVGGSAAGRLVEADLKAEGELGGALRAAGLRLPHPLDGGAAARVGTASFEVSLRGDLDDPSSLRIAPALRFESAPEAVEALRFLRRPFRYTPRADGVRVRARSGPGEFIPLPAVPEPFVRMLLLSEDAGFFGHPGIDVAEIPVAWSENVQRGRFARGASTITQQLARNLFLSREKSYGRKLEEAALALALDAAVPKGRILEIYLNVIEWGPGVYGLPSASRHYFGKHPSQLGVKEMAFLVCLVPSPVRYHSAHHAGRPGPGMEQLMANLLARMSSVGALAPGEYEAALAEPLAFVPEDGDARSPTAG
jgi:hypothetical protein